jgi:hypothetical protein
LQQTAAELVATAVWELFPEVKFLGGGPDGFGFVYEFDFPHPVHPDLGPQIEEKVRQIIKEKRPIVFREMVGPSFQGYYKAKGFGEIDLDGGLFEVFEMGDFVDLAPGPFCVHSGEVGALQILKCEGALRIEGVAAESKEALKTFLKQLKEFVPGQVLAERLGWKRGDRWLFSHLEPLEKLLATHWGGERVSGEGELPEGVFFESGWRGYRVGKKENLKEMINSSLHSLGQCFTILGHIFRFEGDDAQWQILAKDPLGRERVLARLCLKTFGKREWVIAEVPIVKNGELLLEQYAGHWPEQIRGRTV